MIKVLFVCMGNICRSPMAEAVFQDMVNKAGLADKFSIDSAGTGGWHAGQTAHSGTLTVLKKHNIPYNGRARQIDWHDLEQFDYVLAMDRENLSVIKRGVDNKPSANGTPQAEISLFLRFAKDAGVTNLDEVSDPYYHGRFDETYDVVKQGSEAFLNFLRQEKKI